MKLTLRKVNIGGTSSLVAADEYTQEAFKKLSLTDILIGDFAKPRNVKFLRKYFSLMNTAFEMWDAPHVGVYRGKEYSVSKNEEEFRKWLTVVSGHYDAIILPNGAMKFVAKSISFTKMTEDEFAQLYSDTINAIIKHVLPDNGDEAEYMAIFQRILDFD